MAFQSSNLFVLAFISTLKHRRMKQAADVLRLEKETAEKLAAKAFAKSYLADLVPSVFNNLRENGYFFDPVHRDLEVGFMPWLLNQTLTELDRVNLARFILDNMIRDVVSKREIDYENMEQRIIEENLRLEQLANQPVSIQITEPSTQNISGLEEGSTQQLNASNDDNQNETSNQQDEVS